MEGSVRKFFQFLGAGADDLESSSVIDRAQALRPMLVKVSYPERIWLPYWKLILAKVATLQELETHWSITDVWEGMEALDLQQASEALNVQAERDKQK